MARFLPLARFLPPLPEGMAAAWLAEHVPPGSWLLDPLGASPALALEAAQAGYRVLVASNNPIISFIIETLASAPKNADFQSALAELAASKRGEERLEKNIQGLYLTECDTCGARVPATAFFWRKGETAPYARLYHCPKCGESGERPVTKGDLERLAAMGGDKLQRARALQRVILNEEEHRANVEEALESYLARPLYVLFTLINKVEGLGLPPERLRLLQALLVSAFDAGNTLSPWPAGRSPARHRPKQLTIPPQFRENNLWMALESAVEEWVQPDARPVPVTHWPELPGESGICLYHGRVKALVPLPETIDLRSVLTVFPRPNQAFWTLSVLWAGWLWGAEAALPLRNVLDRRRYDWNWHTSAIHNALAATWGALAPDAPLFGLLPELAPGFLSAVLVAAEAAGFQLESLAQRAEGGGRSEPDLAQILWKPAPAIKDRPEPPALPPPNPEELETAAREAIREDLLSRNEPAPYLAEYAAGVIGLVQAGVAPRTQASLPGDLLTRVQAVIARTFANRSFLRLFSARVDKTARAEGAPEEERGVWWLAALPKTVSPLEPLPLADRMEMEVVRYMQKSLTASQGGFTFQQLDQAMCGLFPGLQTPPEDFVRACMESYGEPTAPLSDTWRMRAGETASARKTDLQEMRKAIETVGDRLGYHTVERGNALVWEDQGSGVWWFYRMASSILSRYVLAPLMGPAARSVLVLPGSRARLLNYKLHRDPRLAEAVQGWRFLKFRHLREIAAGKDITAQNWTALLDEDPLTDEATQMTLFPEK